MAFRHEVPVVLFPLPLSAGSPQNRSSPAVLSALSQEKELTGDRGGLHMLDSLRYAARHLRQSPGYVATAVLTFAVAIGANAPS